MLTKDLFDQKHSKTKVLPKSVWIWLNLLGLGMDLHAYFFPQIMFSYESHHMNKKQTNKQKICHLMKYLCFLLRSSCYYHIELSS